MLADQRLLEVSTESVAKLKEEFRLASSTISQHVKGIIHDGVLQMMQEYLLTGTDEQRNRCKLLTLEPKSASEAALAHLTELIEELVAPKTQSLTQRVLDRMRCLSNIQLEYCCNVFAPALTDAHRFVVDGELRSIFEQLRLFRALTVQESAVHSALVAGGTAASGSNASQAPESPVRGGGGGGESGGFGSSTMAASASMSFRFAASAAGTKSGEYPQPVSPSSKALFAPTTSPSRPMASGAPTSVNSRTDVFQALQQSLAREHELHGMLERMTRALQERAAKEQESVEQLKRKMQEAQEAATIEMAQQLMTFRSDMAVLSNRNSELEDRLSKTCEVAYVLDELCGKLNCEVYALKELMRREGVTSLLLARLNDELDRVHTTSCCRGLPLVVDGGWRFGEEPPTAQWMRKVCVGAADVPPAECLKAQHNALQSVLDAMKLESKLAEMTVLHANLQCTLDSERERMSSEVQRQKRAFEKRVQQLEQQVTRVLHENQALREALGSSMAAATASRAAGTRDLGGRTAMRPGPTPPSSRPANSGSARQSLGYSLPACSASDEGKGGRGEEEFLDNDEVYLSLVRTRRELNRALLENETLKLRIASASGATDTVRQTESAGQQSSRNATTPVLASLPSSHSDQLRSAVRSAVSAQAKRPHSARRPTSAATTRVQLR